MSRRDDLDLRPGHYAAKPCNLLRGGPQDETPAVSDLDASSRDGPGNYSVKLTRVIGIIHVIRRVLINDVDGASPKL